MNAIKKRLIYIYHRISFRYTVFISFTLSAFIIILLTVITYNLRFSNQLESTQHGENQMLVEQLSQTLYTYLSNMLRLSDSISFQVIKNTDVSSPSLNEQFQLLYESNNNYIKNITLLSKDGSILATAPPAILKDTVNVAQEPWFQNALSQTENLHFSTPHVQNLFMETENQHSWVVSLSCAAEITDRKIVRKGVLLIDLKYSGISGMLNNITLVNDGYVFLVDSEGTIIYHPQHQLIASGLVKEDNKTLAQYRDGDYINAFNGETRSLIIRSVGYTGWKMIGVIPRTGLSFNSLQNTIFILIIFLLYLGMIILVNSFISNKLTDPIKKLEHSVQQLDTNLEEAQIYIGGSFEIQQLGHTIQQMVEVMRQLTHDIVQEQTQKQKSELNALQAQINPHFLYNTLDIIVWMIEKGRPGDALTVVSALGRFFRLSLSKGKNIITVRDELEHVRNYLMIQTMRYKNKFTYTIDPAPDTLNLSTIKLVIQPIVENAIYHGMNYMDGDGEIRIRSYLQAGDLYISVTDNGLGMTPETVESLFRETGKISKGSGIGIKNVHERIELYFGKPYGLLIQSEPDEGTEVLLHLPAIEYHEMEKKE